VGKGIIPKKGKNEHGGVGHEMGSGDVGRVQRV